MENIFRYHSVFLTNKGKVYHLGKSFERGIVSAVPTIVEYQSNNTPIKNVIATQIACGFQQLCCFFLVLFESL